MPHHPKSQPAPEKHNPATPGKAHDNTVDMNFPQEEERILARWKEIDAFLRQVELVSGRIFLPNMTRNGLVVNISARARQLKPYLCMRGCIRILYV